MVTICYKIAAYTVIEQSGIEIMCRVYVCMKIWVWGRTVSLLLPVHCSLIHLFWMSWVPLTPLSSHFDLGHACCIMGPVCIHQIHFFLWLAASCKHQALAHTHKLCSNILGLCQQRRFLRDSWLRYWGYLCVCVYVHLWPLILYY